MTKYKTRVTAVVLLLGVGYLVGAAPRDTAVQADVRRDQTKPQHFQSGAQRSEALLREISATLGKMDARLDRMEKLATQFVNRIPQRLTGENR